MTESTKERILDAAARLFHEQGYAATGIATILREAGVNAGSLYHFFSGKEAVLVGVLERYERMLHPVVMAPAEAATDDPIGRIFALLAWYRAGMAQTGCALGCPIANLALEVCDTYPEVRPYIDVNFANWAAAVRGWLETARDRLPVDTDLNALSHFVLTVMEGGLMQARAKRSLVPYDASVSQLRAYFDCLEERAARERAGATPERNSAT